MQAANTQSSAGAVAALATGRTTTTGPLALERSTAKDALRFALTVWLVSRVALSILGATILAFAPDSSHEHVRRDYPDVVLPDRDLYGYTIGVWNIYDVRYYVEIAQHGYSGDLGWQTAYYPGYPILVKLFSFPLMGNYLLSTLVVANLFALLFFYFLYRLVNLDYGADVARRAVIWSAIFPASFFLFMGYTESIVLAGMVGALYYARTGKWWLAGLLSGLAACTKQPGIAIILPLAYIFWQQFWPNRRDHPLRGLSQGAWLLLCPLAAGSYLVYRYLFISTPIQGITDVGGAQRLDFPGLPLIQALGAIKPDNTLLAFNLMDIFFTILTIVLVAGVAIKVRSVPHTLFSIALGLMNLSVTMYVYVDRPEVNSPRRLLLAFPIFILLALITPTQKRFKPLAYFSAGLYIVMAGLFANWIFIS